MEERIGQWIILGIIIAVLAFDKVAKLKLFRNSGNPSRNSGNPKYGERLATLEQAVTDIRDDIREIKRRLNNIK